MESAMNDISLPLYEDFGIKYEDKFQTFCEVLKSVGGEAILTTKDELKSKIKELYPNEKLIYSNVPECNLGNFDANAKSDAKELKDIDLAIVKGNFAIAENGAVWMQDEENRHRCLYFIAQNIVIVLNEDEIVNNMHEAYDKISFENSSFGCFISGPSKTADIEQSLVIGAHGAKSEYVIFVKS